MIKSRLPALTCGVVAIAMVKMLVLARVAGDSMRPTLSRGDYILGLRIPRCLLSWPVSQRLIIPRGTVVLVHPPVKTGRLSIKRIDGIGGDIRHWGDSTPDAETQSVPPGHVFLIGDAAWNITQRDRGALYAVSADSRLYGPRPSTAIVARILLKVWPTLCRLRLRADWPSHSR